MLFIFAKMKVYLSFSGEAESEVPIKKYPGVSVWSPEGSFDIE